MKGKDKVDYSRTVHLQGRIKKFQKLDENELMNLIKGPRVKNFSCANKIKKLRG